jgi:hypothetical protein
MVKKGEKKDREKSETQLTILTDTRRQKFDLPSNQSE